ncbi:helix-turn-helix domain-containing protein [Limosilactobacillus reuteri]|uniref:helix-turn-helix domain-containing protein n=1 Tax=Limosilactobacillus reuteri TaxID=1598 RepID=UPI001E2FBB67|nr:helix-turn-helix transcriptional regulator [Limosilactobacillus reuteri]MCC4331506.1 helix-turn-helix domain-containing protein [Limosilactobacillus reuteri]MCC4354805.1 helix-turn-helix domain-containing protein [Limosilactobacillus reuteri]MCC4417539.1 helix-turn-helix domain-containing protein [Limosilactobacillus reuteri]
MEGINEIFAKNLNDLMKRNGENLSELSDRIDVAYSTVSDWQHGKKMPRSGSLQKLADHYKVNISYLTSEHNDDSKLNSTAQTVAAHIDDDTPEEERQQIINFIENLKKARK